MNPSVFILFPALGQLRLDAHDLEALTDQGFITAETRGQSTRHKLRFRRQGRQVVRYLPQALVENIRAELAKLQAPRRDRARRAAVCRKARLVLRAVRDLAPLLEAEGYYLHGRDYRKTRSRHE